MKGVTLRDALEQSLRCPLLDTTGPRLPVPRFSLAAARGAASPAARAARAHTRGGRHRDAEHTLERTRKWWVFPRGPFGPHTLALVPYPAADLPARLLQHPMKSGCVFRPRSTGHGA